MVDDRSTRRYHVEGRQDYVESTSRLRRKHVESTSKTGTVRPGSGVATFLHASGQIAMRGTPGYEHFPHHSYSHMLRIGLLDTELSLNIRDVTPVGIPTSKLSTVATEAIDAASIGCLLSDQPLHLRVNYDASIARTTDSVCRISRRWLAAARRRIHSAAPGDARLARGLRGRCAPPVPWRESDRFEGQELHEAAVCRTQLALQTSDRSRRIDPGGALTRTQVQWAFRARK